VSGSKITDDLHFIHGRSHLSVKAATGASSQKPFPFEQLCPLNSMALSLSIAIAAADFAY
jgi:hypothetical protein